MGYTSMSAYAKDARYVMKTGLYVKEMNGYIKFLGHGGSANYAFVGQTRGLFSKITTFGIRDVGDLARKLSWLVH